MSQKKLFVTLAFVLLIVFAGCQQSQESDVPDPFAAIDLDRLNAPSTQHYRMLDSMQVYGEMTQHIKKGEFEGEDVYIVTYEVAGGTSGSSELIFDDEHAQPIRVLSTQKMGDQTASTTMTYEDGRVVRIIEAPNMPTPDTTTTDIPEGTKDWMQVGFLLQSINLDDVDTLRIPFYQGFGRAFVDTAIITNTGRDTVQVPAGEFDAYQMHVEFANAEADFFIQAPPNSRVLRHQIPGRAGILMTVLIPELSEAAAQPDTPGKDKPDAEKPEMME